MVTDTSVGKFISKSSYLVDCPLVSLGFLIEPRVAFSLPEKVSS